MTGSVLAERGVRILQALALLGGEGTVKQVCDRMNRGQIFMSGRENVRNVSATLYWMAGRKNPPVIMAGHTIGSGSPGIWRITATGRKILEKDR